jgi:hypothetical protein
MAHARMEQCLRILFDLKVSMLWKEVESKSFERVEGFKVESVVTLIVHHYRGNHCIGSASGTSPISQEEHPNLS